MKKISIILATDRSFEPRDFDRYGVATLSKFFNIYLLDFSYFVKQRLHKKNKNQQRLIEKSNIYGCLVITEYRSFNNFLEQHQVSFYIDLMGSSFPLTKIRKILSFHKVKRIKLFLGELPQLNASASFKSRLNSAAKRGKLFYRVIEYVIRKFVLKKIEPKIDISIYSGSVCRERYSNQNNIIFWTHAFDYQTYLNLLRGQNKFRNEKSYAVFLDQNAPTHPDYNFHKNKPPVSEKNYYQSMNCFFDIFEKITGIEVIIASHPRLPENKSQNQWGTRKAVFGKTPLLVKESDLVFAHYSTAISFAVLMKKPILQLLTNEYIASYRYDRFIAFSDALNLTQLNVDNFDNNIIVKQDFFSFDKDAYQNYEEQFLRSRFSSISDLWDEVAEQINKQIVIRG